MIRTPIFVAGAICATLVWFAAGSHGVAKDYIVVIGGGPTKEQNQASMEANVLFFLSLVERQASSDRDVSIFFADGQNPGRDVQYLLETSELPEVSGNETGQATPTSEAPGSPQTLAKLGLRDLMQELTRRGPRGGGPAATWNSRRRIAYRDHEVPNASESDPKLIREKLQAIAASANHGDRVLLYVTAHGSSDRDFEIQNTSIACWKDEIRVKDLASWLAPISTNVPVYYVMAQCYTGGFANLIFEDPTSDQLEMAQQNHIGFMAQQFDLPAAGCRPDIEVDEEYSSYFWGAIVGSMRNGQAILNADLNGDGAISFSEAHAHAVAFSQTIDIPLRSSDRLLREYSYIPNYIPFAERRERGDESLADSDWKSDKSGQFEQQSPAKLVQLKGTIAELMTSADKDNQHIVKSLAADLKIAPDTPFEELLGLGRQRARQIREAILARSLPAPIADQESSQSSERDSERPSDGFSPVRDEGRRGGRQRNSFGRSGRRELLAAIEQKWPELSDMFQARDFAELDRIGSESMLNELRKLPEFVRYERTLAERSLMEKVQSETEMFQVKHRRLIETLELIALEKNMEQVATPEALAKFRELKRLEQLSMFHP